MSSNSIFNCEGQALLTRRSFLKASAILSFAALPEWSLAKDPSETRLLTILLRGGLDGMYAMPPVGDGRLDDLRRNINPDETLKLDKFFALHGAFKNVHDMYKKNEALLVHATSIPYVGRSHFDGQNIMESGVMVPYASQSGWMGRALDLQGYKSVTMSLPTPLVLRGPGRPDNFYPTWMKRLPKHLYEQILPLWAEDDLLAPFATQIETENKGIAPPLDPGQRLGLTELASEAGKRLKEGLGPRMAVLDHVGFDTHANEPRDHDRRLEELDEAIGAFREAIGDEVWKKTLVVTVTEFGRTAAENGSLGTDHGWGTAILVLGGKLKKGGIVADWPGLKKAALYEGRDLTATIDARALYGSIMSTVLEIDPELVRRKVLEYEPTDVFGSYI